MSVLEIIEIKSKILKGVDLAGKKLIENSIKENLELVISQKGKIEFIKAADLIDKVKKDSLI